MTRWTRFRRLFGLEPGSPWRKSDVDAELALHLELRIRELVARGESPERARELALRRFGDYEQLRQVCVEIDQRRRRRMIWTRLATDLRHDIGYALRMFRRAPGFAAIAVATLALGIGATSAIFTVVNGVLLESLPYPDADRLHRVRMLYPDGTAYTALSAPDFMSVRRDAAVFERVEGYTTRRLTLLDAGDPQEVRGLMVSDGLLPMLGLRVALGRAFELDDHAGARVALLTHGFWQRQFGGDRTVLGRVVRAAGDPYTIVGVLEPGARLPATAEMLTPLEYDNTFSATTATARRSEYLAVIGRARPAVSLAQIDAELGRLGTVLQEAFPNSNAALTFNAIPLRDLEVGDTRLPLAVLLGAVGVLLVVACTNLANLLLARGSARSGELAVRAAIGAGRGRLVRQLLTEALVLGTAGGAAGLALAWWGTTALVAAQPADLPRLEDVRVDTTVVLFTLGLALLTSVAFGLMPAVQAAGTRLTDPLREHARSGSAGGRRLRAALVVAETALAVVLLTGAGLLIRTFVELAQVDPGFDSRHAVTLRVGLQGGAYQTAAQLRLRVPELEERLRSMPGIAAVGATTSLPFSGLGSIVDFAVEGAPPPPPDVNAEIAVASVTPEYFRAIGTRIVSGRDVSDRDHADAEPVAVINEAAVRRWFGGEDPLGRQVLMSGVRRRVVGVVRDVLQRAPGEPAVPQLFAPYAQRTTRTVHLVVRGSTDPGSRIPAIRAQLRAFDPDLPVPAIAPLADLNAASVARPRFYASLLALFAGVALVLAATGIFGVMSYTVAQHTREIGIRMALGARPGGVLSRIVGRTLALAGAGFALGALGSAALGRMIQGLLFGVPPADPVTIAAVVVVLGTSATIAGFVPALRAARIDPTVALRE